MVGANYMGGKRNTARTKSKDVVGRAQRRHFGKQRLASALCATQGNLIPSSVPPTLSSILPEITLAHARCDASTRSGTISSRKFFDGDRLYSSTSPSNTPRRNKPSKVLGALDISDHTSMRAAIDRILQQPTLVGINTPDTHESAYIERTQSAMAGRQPTEASLISEDPCNHHSEIASTRVFNPDVLYPSPGTPTHEHTDLPEIDSNVTCERIESGALSLADSLPDIWDVISRKSLDDSNHAERQSLTGANLFSCVESSKFKSPKACLYSFYPLPRSSPIPSSPQSSNNSILDLDTSPPAAIRIRPSDNLSGESDNSLDVSSLRSISWPVFLEPFRSYSIHEASIETDEEPFTILSPADSDSDNFEAERSHTTYYNDTHAFPSTQNDDFRRIALPDYGCDSIPLWASGGVVEDNVPGGISFDFLSDPHPWETIDKILELKPPEPSAVQSLMVGFTKDREGVGYVSPERSGICNRHLSDVTSFETRIDDKGTDDTHVSPSENPPILGIADIETPNTDGRMAIDVPDSRCANDLTRLLFDMGPPTPESKVNNLHSHVHASPEASTTLTVVHCTEDEDTRAPSTGAIFGGAITAKIDVDATFEGPCLFGDSDLEEEDV